MLSMAWLSEFWTHCQHVRSHQLVPCTPAPMPQQAIMSLSLLGDGVLLFMRTATRVTYLSGLD